MIGFIAYIPIGLFIAMMVIVAMIDLRRRKIYNAEIVVLLMIWVVWAIIVTASSLSEGMSFLEAIGIPLMLDDVSILDGLSAAIIFGIGSLLITVVFERATGRFAMGGGDIKLLFVVGLFLGIEGEAIALLIACGVFAITGLVMRRSKDDALPFGPFIAAGSIVALFL